MFRFGAACLVVVVLGAGFGGCGTSAVGSDECRSIESARCSAGRFCDLGIDSASKYSECQSFARDNCLHGLASGQTPLPSDVNRCVAAINAAGSCAHRQGAKTLPADCDTPPLGAFATSRTTVCDVVLAPESTSECGFLTQKPVTPKDAATD
jgi:hypothetical protein